MLSQNMKLEIATPLPCIVTESALVHLTLLVVDHVLPLYGLRLSGGDLSPLQCLHRKGGQVVNTRKLGFVTFVVSVCPRQGVQLGVYLNLLTVKPLIVAFYVQVRLNLLSTNITLVLVQLHVVFDAMVVHPTLDVN